LRFRIGRSSAGERIVVVGPKQSLEEILAILEDVRRSAEEKGIVIGERLKALGLEDEYLFEDPWVDARPGRRLKRSR
jgi:hypothetical protein